MCNDAHFNPTVQPHRSRSCSLVGRPPPYPIHNNPATQMDNGPYTELERTAINHIAKMCASTFKAAAAYLALMRAIKLRIELEGYTPPVKEKTKPEPKKK